MPPNEIKWLQPTVKGAILALDGPPYKPSWFAPGTPGQVLTIGPTGELRWDTAAGSGGANPMTSVGDLITALAGGVPVRLPIGPEGSSLMVQSGVPAWLPATPMTQAGDLIVGGPAGVATRLPIGAETRVLTIQGGVPAWVAPASGGMTNPMTAAGDLIQGGIAGAPARLPAGSEATVLTMLGGVPTWQAPNVAVAGSGQWNWSTTPTSGPPVTAGKAAVNNLTTPTLLVLSTTTDAGVDATGYLSRLQANDLIYLQDKNDSTLYWRFKVTGAVTIAGGAATIPVATQGTQGGALNNNQAVLVTVGLGGGTTGGMTNPMTAPNDLIIGGAAGTPTRLPVGAESRILQVSAGAVSWQPYTAMSNPMSNLGDLIVGGGPAGDPAFVNAVTAGVPIADGTVNLVITAGGSFLLYVAATSSFGPSFTNTLSSVTATRTGGGPSLTFSPIINGVNAGAAGRKLYVWGSPCAAGAEYTLAATWVGNIDLAHAVMAFSGVNAGTPLGTPVTDLDGNVNGTATVAAPANALAVDFMSGGAGPTFTPGAGQTAMFTPPVRGNVSINGTYKVGSVSILMQQTLTASGGGNDVYGAVALLPATSYPPGTPLRLPVGSNGQVLTVVGGLPAWATPAAAGMTNPMTTVGDLIVGGTAGAPTRLADVAVGSVLASGGVGVAPAWSSAPSLTNLTLTGLTPGRVVYPGSGSILTGNSGFVFDNTNINLRMFGATVGTNGSRVFALGSVSAVRPTTRPADTVQLVAVDLQAAGTTGLVVMDEAGLTLELGTLDVGGVALSGLHLTAADARVYRIGGGGFHYPNGTAPGTPPAGTVVTYSKSDKKLYQKDDAGLETLLASVAGMTNPMTTAGDLITGGASGVAGRLGIGSTGQVLTVAAGAPAWQTPPAQRLVPLPLDSARFTTTAGFLGPQPVERVSTGTPPTDFPAPSELVLQFSSSTKNVVVWKGIVPASYAGGAVTLVVKYSMATATLGFIKLYGSIVGVVDMSTDVRAIVPTAGDQSPDDAVPTTLGQQKEIRLVLAGASGLAAGRKFLCSVMLWNGATTPAGGDRVLELAWLEF